MLKKVQKKSKDLPAHPIEDQDSQPILCDGCNHFISQYAYLRHWRPCVTAARQMKKSFSQQKMQEKEQLSMEITQATIKEMQEKEEPKIVGCIKCGMMLLEGEEAIQNHYLDCRGEEKKCQYCEEQFPPALMQEHFKLCQMKTVIQQSRRMAQNKESKPQQRPLQVSKRETFRTESEESNSRQEQNQRSNLPLSDLLGRMLTEVVQTGNSRSRNTDLLQDFFNALRPHQRFSQAQIKSLKSQTYSQKQAGQDRCTICMQDLQTGHKVINFTCSHTFHIECAKQWLKKNVVCPNCKTRAKQ